MEKVTFKVGQIDLVGDLHAPAGAQQKKRPAVAILGPMTYQKEQTPTQYAKRLAEQGFASLAYDSRYRGRAAVSRAPGRTLITKSKISKPPSPTASASGCRPGPRFQSRDLPGEFVWVWYQPWADRDAWDNRYAVMSDADLLSYDSIGAANDLRVPWLMIHGDNCFLPSAARRHMESVPEATKTETIWDETPHLAYYDQLDAIDRATSKIVAWFRDG
ncbi:MAG: alpha/beta hydrolase [Myxococcota bacterium]